MGGNGKKSEKLFCLLAGVVRNKILTIGGEARTISGVKVMSRMKKVRNLQWILVVWSLVTWLRVGSEAEIIDRVVAVVDKDVITSSELEREARLRFGKDQRIPSAEAYKQLLTAIIEQKLILREAAANEVKVSDQEVERTLERIVKQNGISTADLRAAVEGEGISWEQYLAQLRNDILRNHIVAMKVYSQVNISEKDYADYYKAHENDYIKPATVRIEQLLFSVGEDASSEAKTQIKGQATTARARLQAGEDFRSVGEALGVVKSGESVDFGSFGKGELMEALDEAAFSLAIGTISDVLETERGFAIIRVLDRTEKQARSLDEVKEEIGRVLYQQKADRKYKEWMDGLVANAYIETKL